MNVPEDVEQASKELADILGEFTTPAYGLGDDNAYAQWMIYVVADVKPDNLPKVYSGFKVVFRETPVLY